MTPADNNLPEINSGSPDSPEQKEPEGFDPKKLNLTLVLAGIFAVLLMWYLSAKIF